jgi:hypothetical protein
MGGTPSKHLSDSGRKTVLKASVIVKSKGNGGTTATTIQTTPRKLPRNPSELESIITQPTREQWSAVMDPTTNTSNTTSLMHKKNPELVSNMHKIMNSSSGKITESVINTVGKRREKMVNANGKMKPEEIYQLVKAVSSSKSSKKIEDEELNAIAKEHAHLVDKMDARIVKEYLAAPRLEKVMMRERQKLRTVGRWPE